MRPAQVPASNSSARKAAAEKVAPAHDTETLAEVLADALDYLVDMARGHDYAEIAKISAAEDAVREALADHIAQAAPAPRCICHPDIPVPANNCRAHGLAARIVQARAEETVDGQANDCTHGSATGIDTAPCGPDKVWACDHCGLRWRQDGEPLARAGEGALRERIAAAEPTWHRGMYGCPDDMFSRRDLMALLAETDRP